MEYHFWKEAKSISPSDDHTVQDETAKKGKHFQDVKVAAGNIRVSDFLGRKNHSGFLSMDQTNDDP